jgi:hypothetical protein
MVVVELSSRVQFHQEIQFGSYEKRQKEKLTPVLGFSYFARQYFCDNPEYIE